MKCFTTQFMELRLDSLLVNMFWIDMNMFRDEMFHYSIHGAKTWFSTCQGMDEHIQYVMNRFENISRWNVPHSQVHRDRFDEYLIHYWIYVVKGWMSIFNMFWIDMKMNLGLLIHYSIYGAKTWFSSLFGFDY